MISLNDANDFFLKFLRRITLKNSLELFLYSGFLVATGIFLHYKLPFIVLFAAAALISFATIIFNASDFIQITKLDLLGINLMYIVGAAFFAVLPADSFAITLIFVATIKGILKTKIFFIMGTERARLTNTFLPFYALITIILLFLKKYIPQVPSSLTLQVITLSCCLASMLNTVTDLFTIEKCKSFLDKHITYFDQLTSVYNRRLLTEWAPRTDIAAIAYIDIDSFKFVNDTFGHATGDKVLVSLCNEITRRIKGDDNVLLVREVGEKFILICQIFDDSSRKLIINLIDYYRNNTIEVNGITIQITLSIGVYQNQGGESLERMIIEADQLLHYAKTNGKNCLVIDYRKVH